MLRLKTSSYEDGQEAKILPHFTQLAAMTDTACCVGHRSLLYRPMQQAA